MADTFNGNYILSSAIAVYPSAYRSPQHDFAARLNLEESFITLSKQANRNYIYSWDDATANTSALLVVFVGGYLFKIKVAKSSITDDNRYLCIKTKEVGTTDTKKTKVLINFDTNSLILDEQPSGVIDYYFKGAAFTNIKDGTDFIDLKDPASYYIVSGDKVLSNYKKVNDSRPVALNLVNGTEADNSDTSLTNLHKTVQDDTVSYSVNTLENVINSLALGTGNILTGTTTSQVLHNSLVIGENNKATGGNKTITLIGEGLEATSDYQTIIGKYNVVNGDNAFAIGAGNNATTRKNIFEVRKNTGNTTIAGTLNISQDETIDGTALNIQHGDFNVADGNARIEKGLYIKGTNGTGGLVVDQNSVLSGPVSCSSTLEVTGTTTGHAKLTIDAGGADISKELIVRSSGNSAADNSKISLYGTGTGDSVTYKTTFEYDTSTQCLKIKVS